MYTCNYDIINKKTDERESSREVQPAWENSSLAFIEAVHQWLENMPHDWRPLSNVNSLVYGTVDSSPYVVIIGYWLDMEIYVRVLVRSNIARRQERNITYAPVRVVEYIFFHIQLITVLLHTRYYYKK